MFKILILVLAIIAAASAQFIVTPYTYGYRGYAGYAGYGYGYPYSYTAYSAYTPYAYAYFYK